MNRFKSIIWVLVLTGVLSTACTDKFAEYNQNPNNVTEDDLQMDNIFLGAFFVKMIQNIFPYGGTGSSSTNAYQNVENLHGDVYGGYHGQTHNWSTSGDGLTYNFSMGWNGSLFSVLYTGVMGNWKFIKERTELDYPDLFAVAQMIKIYAAQRTTDSFGPIPYSKAGEGIGSEYDSQSDIYYSLLEELTTAIKTLKPYADRGSSLLQLFDDVYKGNYAQWVRFGNTLKLRIAMRMAYVDATAAQKAAEEAVNDSYGVMTENDANAIIRGVDSSSRTYNNPLGGLTEDYNEARMSANMESFLVGYNDPRLSAYFKPATNPDDNTNTQERVPRVYLGLRSGLRISDAQAKRYVSYSKLKSDFEIIWMTAAEAYFLRAEGALREWNMGGTAQGLYEEGIRKSFEQWRAGDASAYLADETSKPKTYEDEMASAHNIGEGSRLSTITIKWNEGAGFEEKLERIITQKWIAIYPNGQEAWSEFRRTRYPKLFPVHVNNSGGTINTDIQIRRVPYPTSEYRTNEENLLNGIKLLGGSDNGGTRLWWDKKP